MLLSLPELQQHHVEEDWGLEPHALMQLANAGFTLTPLRLVSAQTEARFYTLNNLPAKLRDLFKRVDPQDPDEDDLEELAPQARQLLRQHYLLDEVVDAFYEGIAGMPARLSLRRFNTPDVSSPCRTAVRGRPALLALKAVWEDAWSEEEVCARLRQHRSFSLQPRPVLIAPGGAEADDGVLSARVSEVLGRKVRAICNAAGEISGIDFRTLP